MASNGWIEPAKIRKKKICLNHTAILDYAKGDG